MHVSARLIAYFSDVIIIEKHVSATQNISDIMHVSARLIAY